MGSSGVLMVAGVLMMAMMIGCESASVGHMPSTKEESEDFKRTQEAADSTWTDWAKDKLSGAVGMKSDDTKTGIYSYL